MESIDYTFKCHKTRQQQISAVQKKNNNGNNNNLLRDWHILNDKYVLEYVVLVLQVRIWHIRELQVYRLYVRMCDCCCANHIQHWTLQQYHSGCVVIIFLLRLFSFFPSKVRKASMKIQVFFGSSSEQVNGEWEILLWRRRGDKATT